jgi:hypothetical protein
MVAGNDAKSKTVGRVHRVARISVKPTVAENGAVGKRVNARNLLEEKAVFVLHIAAWSKDVKRTRVV